MDLQIPPRQKMADREAGASVRTEVGHEIRKPIPLHSSPNYLFWCLHKTSMAIVTEEIERVGADITPVQYAALVGIQAHPGIDQASLANVIGYDRATLGGIIDRLERKALLSRRVHAADRRARVLFLEPAGLELISRLEGPVEDAQARILAPLPENDRKTFLKMVARLLRDNLLHGFPD